MFQAREASVGQGWRFASAVCRANVSAGLSIGQFVGSAPSLCLHAVFRSVMCRSLCVTFTLNRQSEQVTMISLIGVSATNGALLRTGQRNTTTSEGPLAGLKSLVGRLSGGAPNKSTNWDSRPAQRRGIRCAISHGHQHFGWFGNDFR